MYTGDVTIVGSGDRPTGLSCSITMIRLGPISPLRTPALTPPPWLACGCIGSESEDCALQIRPETVELIEHA